jgi:hypothetical protein
MGTLGWTVNGYTVQKYGLDQELPGSRRIYLPVTVKYTVRKKQRKRSSQSLLYSLVFYSVLYCNMFLLLIKSLHQAQIPTERMPTFLSPHGTKAPSGPGPPHSQGFMITLIWTHHTQQDSSGRMISLTQRPVPDNT